MQKNTRISLIALGISILAFCSAASVASELLSPAQLMARYGLSDLGDEIHTGYVACPECGATWKSATIGSMRDGIVGEDEKL